LLDGDAGHLGRDEVPELVDEHQDDEHHHEGQNRAGDSHQPTAILRSAYRASRTSRSRSRIPPRSGSCEVPQRPTASSITRGIWSKPSRPARNAATATSSAALRIVPRLPPAAAASRTTRYAGYWVGSITRNSSVPHAVGGACPAGDASRSGCVSAYWMGRCISGRPSWALNEPSTNS